jgi:MerR family mercuric resistance operon transcriptional regulator
LRDGRAWASKRCGFTERKGLLEKPPRKESGYRQYQEDAIARLRFIRRAKELGFSLKEVKKLLALSVDPTTTGAEVRQRATQKLAEIEQRIEAWRRIKMALHRLTTACDGRGSVSQCPILDALKPFGSEQRTRFFEVVDRFTARAGAAPGTA